MWSSLSEVLDIIAYYSSTAWLVWDGVKDTGVLFIPLAAVQSGTGSTMDSVIILVLYWVCNISTSTLGIFAVAEEKMLFFVTFVTKEVAKYTITDQLSH